MITFRKTSGALYHTELARQISDFTQNILPTTPGGIMPLAQVYCLYNRARGTGKNIIRPDIFTKN
jgi:ESCRT-II complex subunit VPS36